MDGSPPSTSSQLPPGDRTGLRRAAAAIAISLLVHIAVAWMMRPTFKPVNDFAVDLEITTLSKVPPNRPPEPEPEPKPEPEPEAPPEEEPPKPAPKKKAAPKVASTEAKVAEAPADTATEESQPAVQQETDTSEGGGICMHNLFAFETGEPNWLLYVAASAFRESAYERELDNTFNSFELGRRLSEMTGMNLTRDVESLLAATSDIFDWRAFRITLSYDFGEGPLMARIKEKQKKAASFAWTKTDDGFEAKIAGQFRWELLGSGRVMSIVHEPEHRVIDLPDNPFADTGAARDTDLQKDTESEGGAPTEGGASVSEENASKTAAKSSKRPRQIECIALASQKKKSNPAKENLMDIAEGLMAPDNEGHWPVAVLTTSDPRAVGLGARMGKRMGFEVASVRGYFTDPVRLEGYLRFSKDPEKVAALRDEWQNEAERFAKDPLMAVAGVSSLLKNLTLTTEGSTLKFSLELKQSQVLSTLLFLQLQGKALERQLMSDE